MDTRRRCRWDQLQLGITSEESLGTFHLVFEEDKDKTGNRIGYTREESESGIGSPFQFCVCRKVDTEED